MRDNPITLTLEYLPSFEHLPHSTTIYTLPGGAVSSADNLFLTLDELGVSGRAHQLIEQFTDSIGVCSFRSQRFTGRAWAAVLRPPKCIPERRKQEQRHALIEPLIGEDDVGGIRFIYVLYNNSGIGYDILVASSPVDPVKAFPEVLKEMQAKETKKLEVRDIFGGRFTSKHKADGQMVERVEKVEKVVEKVQKTEKVESIENLKAPPPPVRVSREQAAAVKDAISKAVASEVKEQVGDRRSARIQNAKDKKQGKDKDKDKDKGKEKGKEKEKVSNSKVEKVSNTRSAKRQKTEHVASTSKKGKGKEPVRR